VALAQETTASGRLPAEHLEWIRAAGKECAVPGGQVIFREGEIGDGVYLLMDGEVEISAALGTSGTRVLTKVGPSELFGEMAVIDDRPRSATATTTRPARLVFIPSGSILRLTRRNPELAISLLRVITHRLREFNTQYLQEMVQAERLSAVGQFTRSIMHDIKNPLHAIGLSAELAAMPDATTEARVRAQALIQRQVEKMTSLIGEVLEFASGPSPVKFVPATMRYDEFLRGVLDDFTTQAAHHNVSVQMEEPLPAMTLPLNPKRLQRAFQNLLVNALEAMPEGGTIFLRVREEGNWIVTEIEDTGPGVPGEIVDRVFEPFATCGKVFGTGLGLSICRRIIEDHGGSIRHKPEPGKGAIFVIKLPTVSPG